MKRLLVFALLTLALAVGLYLIGTRITHSMASEVMGTTLTIRIDDPNPRASLKAALAEAQKLDRLFSKYQEKSDISLINRFAGAASIEVSAATLDVIEKAQIISELSGGAFDITQKNYRDIYIDPPDQTVRLASRNLKIDLGGIGKGYAVEAIRQLLKSRGVTKALIDMRSSIAVIGGPWRIGIQDPRKKDKLLGTLELNEGQAISTSGNYEQGKHIIDPRTGLYVESCLGVTVLTDDAAVADALSTAIFVMGPEKGLEFVRTLKDVECLIIQNDGKIVKTEGIVLQ